MPPKGDDDPFGVRPNAPISLVKAAKASLKEPTRPVTPSDYGRQLFSSGDAGNRPTTAHSAPSSKLFYQEQGPKLALPKLDPARPDTAAFGLRPTGDTLQRVPSGSARDLGDARGRGSFGRTSEEPSTSTTARHGRPTAAETVAALKTGLATGNAHLLYYEGPIVNDGDGPTLDPRRNDDLPPRPTTSRGRLGSSTGEMDPMPERYDGPTPQQLGNGAQVLDCTADQYAAESSGDGDEYEEGRGQHAHHLHDEYGRTHQQRDVSAAHSASVSGEPRSVPGSSANSGSAPLPPHLAPPPAPRTPLLDPSDAFLRWRGSVESSLNEVSCTIAAAAPSAQLLQHTGALAGLVEEVRKQEHPSRWLNSPSTSYCDSRTGQALTMREAIAEHAYQLMDSKNAEVLVKACSIVLRVVKSKQPLLAAAKIMYRLSKDSANDPLFRRTAVLEPIVHTVHIMAASAASSSSGPTSMHEPLMYFNGCLKNISIDASNQKALAKLGALHVLSALLNHLAAQADAEPSALDSVGQVAVQVTGVLRNLAVCPTNAPVFVTSGTVPAMRAACKALWQHGEVVLNVGRVLSKLTLAEGCVEAIERDWEYAPMLIKLLGRHSDSRPILLRIAFVLGNLTTYSHDYRQQVAMVPGALTTVVSILQRYTHGGEEGPGASGSGPEEPSPLKADSKLARSASRQECVVKVLRLAANLAIHPDVGPQLAAQPGLAGCLLALLEGHTFEAAEELVLNCVCALTNLSYYRDAPGFTNQVLALPAERLLCHITPLLLCDNEEAVVEAARVYGNFSRREAVRSYMVASRVLDAFVLLLDHGNPEVLYSVCGTLINFLMDASKKRDLVAQGGVTRLIEVLGRVAGSCLAAEEEEEDEGEGEEAAEAVQRGEEGEQEAGPSGGHASEEMQVAVLDAVCKALFNVCVDDNKAADACASGGASSSGGAGGAGASDAAACSFTTDEVEEVLAILEHLEGSRVLGEREELAGVASRLGTQLLHMHGRLASLELESLPPDGSD